MNYYERHLGDYAKDTGHLTMLEHGAYTLLLDRYYATEQGIPADQAYRITRARTKDERAAVDSVLSEFFDLEKNLWTKGRVVEEISSALKRISSAQENGKKGGRPRKTETQPNPTGFSLGSVLETQSKALQTPDTRHQTPVSIQLPLPEASDGGSAAPSASAAPTPPPDFDGLNDETLNGKAVVPLASTWGLPEQWGLDAEALGFKAKEIGYQAEKFRQYWTRGRGAGTRRSVKGWRQSWSNWLEKAAKDAQR